MAQHKYYRIVHEYKGQHYFKVTEGSSYVVKITYGTQPKKGRPFCPGITLINAKTFWNNYAWQVKPRNQVIKSDQSYCKEIEKKEYTDAYNCIIKKLK